MDWKLPVVVLFVVFVSGCVQESLTPDLVMQRPDLFLGKEISVGGVADYYRVICTAIACPEENPCCNTCGSSLALSGESEKIMVRGKYQEKEVMCSGNECNTTCWPLDIGKKYRVMGVLKGSYGGYYLELEGFVEVG